MIFFKLMFFRGLKVTVSWRKLPKHLQSTCSGSIIMSRMFYSTSPWVFNRALWGTANAAVVAAVAVETLPRWSTWSRWTRTFCSTSKTRRTFKVSRPAGIRTRNPRRRKSFSVRCQLMIFFCTGAQPAAGYCSPVNTGMLWAHLSALARQFYRKIVLQNFSCDAATTAKCEHSKKLET